MKIKKLLAILLTVVFAFSCFSVIPMTVSAEETTTTTTTVATEDAVFIGKTANNQISNIFIPLGARSTTIEDGAVLEYSGDTHFKVTFKAKMLSGEKPILGFLRTVYGTESPSDGTCSEQFYVNNGSDGKTGEFYAPLYTSYDTETGIFEAIFGATVSDNYYKTPSKGNKGARWGYLTIGNAEHNGTSHGEHDYDVSFIMSDIKVQYCEDFDGELMATGESIVPDFSDDSIDFNGTYFHRKQSTDKWDNFFYAGANKWHIDTSPENIKHIKVPVDYNTSSNYDSANFVKTAETDYTREYYTNANYSGMYFAKLDKSSDKGFEIVEDINKKVIIIGANHENEEDSRMYEGYYKPSRNRKANIFIPISLGQYNLNYADTPETQYIVKVTVKAKILEGEGYPVLGRIYANKDRNVGDGTGTASEGLGKSANNINSNNVITGTYFNDSEHEKYYDANGNRLTYSYNPETEELVGYIMMQSGTSKSASVWGNNEVLTVGNAENVYYRHSYDSTEFNSSFAISDVKLDVYKDGSASGYQLGELVAEDILPDFYAENIDTTTTWQYRNATADTTAGAGSSHDKDVLRASQKIWSTEGAVGLVNAYDYTECFAKHTLTHKDATDTTREYYACSCGKNYADIAATEEIDDITAKQQMLVINSAGEKGAHIFIPLHLTGFGGNAYYKFTTKLKVLGADAEPNFNIFIARSNGQAGGATLDGDTKIISHSYDKETETLSAIIQVWRPANYNNPINRPHYCYEEPNTGANFLLALGNLTHNGSGAKDNKYYSTFAFAEPELYRIIGESDTTLYDGTNLIADITDKTVEFKDSYALAHWNTSGYYTDASSPMSAPLNTWGRYGDGRGKIGAYDIPAGFFDGAEDDANMLALYGSGNQNAISYETYLEPGATYQFDIDYRTYGGVNPLIRPQVASGSSYVDATLTETSADVDNSHKSVQFTMPTDARKSYNGNFKLYLGQMWPAKRNGSVYFANATLRKVTDGVLGENIIINGKFNYADDTVITADNYDDTLAFWGNNDILNYTQAKTMGIPENFFVGDAKEDKNTAIHINGGNWNELQFKVQLEPSTTYKLSFNYRSKGDVFTLGTRGTGSVAINKLCDVKDSEYLQEYELVTGADKVAGDIGDPNTRIYFAMGTNSYDKEVYISNVKLHKVVDGVTVGTNLVGHLNYLVNDDTGVVELGGDDATSLKRGIAHGWLASTLDKDDNGNMIPVSATVEDVADDFYTFTAYATRLASLRNYLLGEAEEPDKLNYDAVSDDVLNAQDIVRLKKYAAGNANNGAEIQANALLDKIMNAPNTATQGTVYYVSTSGSDSNAGTSANAPLATITKASSKANAGDTILLKRGDIWRAVANSENSYVAKSGVTYGAYGEGDKPLVLGSAKDYSTATWTNVLGNIWKTQISSDAHDGNRVGNIYFFANENDEEPTIIGRVVRDGQRFASYNDLIEEGDVYSDITDSWFGNDKGTVYVYCEGNPATKYGRIEIAEKREVFILESGVTFDNIAIKYAGGHAVNATAVSNVTVTNCEIGYVGGAPLNAEIYGNGIQFGLGGSNITVKNNYVYQCLDAGITFQSWGVDGTTDTTEFKNITFADNLVTNNYYNIEFFTTGTSDYKVGANNAGNGKLTDIYITGNIMRFAGECWSATQRMDSADGTGTYRAANICVTQDAYYVNTSNLNIKNNIFDCTVSSHIYWTWDDVTANVDKTAHVGLNVEGNTFYQKAGAVDNRTMMFGNTSSYSYASSQYGLENAVALFDKNPAKVDWLETFVF